MGVDKLRGSKRVDCYQPAGGAGVGFGGMGFGGLGLAPHNPFLKTTSSIAISE